MGNQKLESETTKPEEKYKLITYPAIQLPEEYTHLIKAPFLNLLRYGNDLFKLVDKEAYFPNYGRYIDSLMKRKNSVVKLAVLDDETVLGWSLFEERVVHFVWVKNEVRRQGIGKSLLPKEFDTITHITNKGMNIWAAKFPEVKFNPWA